MVDQADDHGETVAADGTAIDDQPQGTPRRAR